MNSGAPLPEGLDRLAQLISRAESIGGRVSVPSLLMVGDRYRSVTAIDPARLIGDAESLAVVADTVAAECAEHRAIAADWDASWRGAAAEAAARQWHGFLEEETARVEALTAAAAAADRCGHDVAERLADLRIRVDRADREIPYADDVHLIDEVLAVGAGASADSERVRRLLGIDGSAGPVDPMGPVDPADAETRARHWLEATFVPAVVDAADAVLGWCEATADEIRRLLAIAGAALEVAGEIGSVSAGPEPSVDGITHAPVPNRVPEPPDRVPEPNDSVPEPTGEQGRAVQPRAIGEGGGVTADSVPASASTAAGTTHPDARTQPDGTAHPSDPALGDSGPGDSGPGDSATDRADITELIDAGIGLGLAVAEFATAVVEAGTAVVEAGTAVVEGVSDAIVGADPTGAGTDPTGAGTDPTRTDAPSAGPVPADPGAAAAGGGDATPDSAVRQCADSEPDDPQARTGGVEPDTPGVPSPTGPPPAVPPPAGPPSAGLPPAVPPDPGHAAPPVGPLGTGRPSSDEQTAAITPDTSPTPPPAPEPPGDAPLGPERGELAQAGPLRPVGAV